MKTSKTTMLVAVAGFVAAIGAKVAAVTTEHFALDSAEASVPRLAERRSKTCRSPTASPLVATRSTLARERTA